MMFGWIWKLFVDSRDTFLVGVYDIVFYDILMLFLIALWGYRELQLRSICLFVIYSARDLVKF